MTRDEGTSQVPELGSPILSRLRGGREDRVEQSGQFTERLNLLDSVGPIVKMSLVSDPRDATLVLRTETIAPEVRRVKGLLGAMDAWLLGGRVQMVVDRLAGRTSPAAIRVEAMNVVMEAAPVPEPPKTEATTGSVWERWKRKVTGRA